MGRQTELAALRAALAGARLGRGTASALVAPAGMGKSRLAREAAAAARAWEVPVLVGRAVEAGASTAFRPLIEALHAGLRRTPEFDDPALTPFRPVLGRLLPQWRMVGAGADDAASGSLSVLGEAVLRLLATFAGTRGLVVVVEDLHWADAETLTVLEYLADNITDVPVLLVLTVRDDPGPALRLVRTLAERHACTLHHLSPLAGAEVEEMAAACLGVEVSPQVATALRQRAAGTPLLVEELLTTGADPAVVIPATVTEMVAGRLDALPPVVRRCVEGAAVLGERFDWRLLPTVVDLPEPEVLAGLRAACRAGLIEPRGQDEFGFHHALGRDAVLAALLPPDRMRWARSGLDAVIAAHPRLEGGWCDLAADLALSAGDTGRAARVLLEAGRRNLAAGALASAETALLRAGTLLAPDAVLVVDIDEALAEAYALAGKTVDAVTVTVRTIGRLQRTAGSTAVLAAAHLRLARVHMTAGEWLPADQQLNAARGHAVDEDTILRIASVAAQVALGDSRFDEAARLASHALTTAERARTPQVMCEALLVLGRIARRNDLTAAEELFEQARIVAEDAGMAIVAARAFEELAIGDVQESLRLDRLDEATRRARTRGDIAATAVIDLQRTATQILRWELDGAASAARTCVAASRRYRLATLPKALVLGAFADILDGRGDAAESVLAEAIALAPDDPHLLGEVWGARAHRALTIVDDHRALTHLNRAMDAFARRPNEVTGSPSVGLAVLLSVVCDPALHTPPTPPEPVANRWNRGLARFTDAVALGRNGDPDAALAAFADADTILREPVDVGWHRLQARRLTSVAALADGWGEPARWASEDLPQLEARGQQRWATAVRGLLRRSGAVVPRRGRGDAPVPDALRALGITSRETDVLLLVAEGRTTGAIAAQLFLSPRTIEKHLERLLAKTGLTRRTELVAYATRLLHTPAGTIVHAPKGQPEP